VKELQYFCGEPFEYLYELYQWNFYSNMLGKNTYLECILKYFNCDSNNSTCYDIDGLCVMNEIQWTTSSL